MKAARYERTGTARDVLLVDELDRPEPGQGQVRVRIAVSGVNPTDVKTRAGATPRPIDGFQVPHQDGAGEIDAVGAGVDASRVGQRVWVYFAAFGNRWGTAAEYSVVPERNAVPLPENASYELAACLGVPAMTARHCLLADGPVDGRTLLVAGGAGAVGHYAVELGRHLGATVVTTVSGPEKAELARAAGAEHVITYTEAGAAERITDAVGSVDRIVEVALGANLELDLAVSRQGTVVCTYAAEPDDPSLPTRRLMNAGLVLRFMLLYNLSPADLDAAAADVAAAVSAGALSRLPVTAFGLDDVVAAQEAVEAGTQGKVLLDLR